MSEDIHFPPMPTKNTLQDIAGATRATSHHNAGVSNFAQYEDQISKLKEQLAEAVRLLKQKEFTSLLDATATGCHYCDACLVACLDPEDPDCLLGEWRPDLLRQVDAIVHGSYVFTKPAHKPDCELATFLRKAEARQ